MIVCSHTRTGTLTSPADRPGLGILTMSVAGVKTMRQRRVDRWLDSGITEVSKQRCLVALPASALTLLAASLSMVMIGSYPGVM